tara:strand:+ start:1017 stop:3215 length:2199 start_codon:yes stop_codon:yes gene_type:complete
LPAEIRRFQELTVVRENEQAERWIISSGHRQGLFGPDNAYVWQLMSNGIFRLGDIARQTFYASHQLEIDKPQSVSVFSDSQCIWFVPHRDGRPETIVFDLVENKILARLEGLQSRQYALGRIAADGCLILQGSKRVDDVVYSTFHRADPSTGDVQEDSIALRTFGSGRPFTDFLTASPLGSYWLKTDTTHFPMVKHAQYPGQPPRKYYGYTLQVWSAFPMKFERRIVVAWLKAEDLPDETHTLKSDELRELSKEMAAQKGKSSPAPLQPRGVFGRVFGRRGVTNEPLSLEQRYFAILAASAPARDRIYSALSAGIHRPDAEPGADYPPRSAFPEAAQDDELWDAIEKNSNELFQNTLRDNSHVGWEGEDVVWFKRLDHLICVGMDGSVSPQIWFERAGMQRMMRPFPNLPGELEVIEGRKLRAVKRHHSVKGVPPDAPAGTLEVDGFPVEPRYEPLRVSKYIDGYQDLAEIPVHYANKIEDEKAVGEFRKQRSTVTIPLKSMEPEARIEAIHAYRDMLDPSFFDRATDNTINVRFKFGKKLIPEVEFFSQLAPQDKEWAAGPLRDLIERYVEASRSTIETFYQKNGENGSLLAQAVRRLGEMDEDAIPLLIAYGEGIDGGHEYYFAGDTMPAVIEAHGWSDQVTAFVAWALAFNYYNTYDSPSTIWRDIGLGEALQRRSAEDAATFVQNELAPFLEAGRLDLSSFARLREKLGRSASAWELEFFDRFLSVPV